jgi:hypothetical protein
MCACVHVHAVCVMTARAALSLTAADGDETLGADEVPGLNDECTAI